MKGVILCAGKGKRMQPFSVTIPKTMLPVVNRPLVAYCLEKMMKAGIEEIAIVVHPNQQSLIHYLTNYKTKLTLFYQQQQLGIAHALSLVESFVGDDSFLMMLGDNLISEPIDTLVSAFQGNHGSILLSKVENPSEYGIAEIVADRVVNLVEKPAQPTSNLAVIGMYLFSSAIFQAVQSITLSNRGEYEIIDAIQWLIHQGYSISYSTTKASYADVGTIDRWLVANEWMLQDQLGTDIQVGKHTKLENCKLRGPMVIGDHCVLTDAIIGPYVSIGDYARLENCTVSHSICLDYTEICQLTRPVVDSVLGQHAILHGELPKQQQMVKLVLGDHSKLSISE
jgi:glucose-1-phosphate thymidylyltransferase